METPAAAKTRQEKSPQVSPHAFWGEAMASEEPLRESRFPLVNVQTALAWRIIEPLLEGSPRVLDAGAGAGRYSLPIAAAGHRVTHLDFSDAMLSIAMTEAARQGLSGIDFVRGDVKALKFIYSRDYGLTLCLDAPISYAYPDHGQALAEVCRVTAGTVVVMVSSRSGVLPFFIDMDLSGEFLPPGYDQPIDPLLMTEGIWRDGVEAFPPELREHLAREGKLTPPDYAFTPEELTAGLNREGFEVVQLGGPGALARSIRPESLAKIQGNAALYERFIQLSLEFDFNTHNLGLGGVNLLAVARRRSNGASGHGKLPKLPKPPKKPKKRNSSRVFKSRAS
ncbi:MAG: methyltransferase domain-containing protein [bacterium]